MTLFFKFKLHRSFVLAVLAVPLFLLSCSEALPPPTHAALIIMHRYHKLSRGTNTVVPYRVNLMALDMLARKNSADGYKVYITECRNYIQWYLNHVNPIDKYDISGTVYEYDVDADGSEISRNSYHAADSTSATFVLLIHRFHEVTGYTRVLRQNRKKIKDAIYLIAHLQDSADGLIRALPVSGKKFLANNCLDYAAISAYLELAKQLDWGETDYYQELKQNLEEAIPRQFYRPKRDEFYWLVDKGLKYAPDWQVLSPDSYSQLFPLLFRLPPLLNERRGHRLWRKFTGYHREKILQLDEVQRLIYTWTETLMEEENR